MDFSKIHDLSSTPLNLDSDLARKIEARNTLIREIEEVQKARKDLISEMRNQAGLSRRPTYQLALYPDSQPHCGRTPCHVVQWGGSRWEKVCNLRNVKPGRPISVRDITPSGVDVWVLHAEPLRRSGEAPPRVLREGRHTLPQRPSRHQWTRVLLHRDPPERGRAPGEGRSGVCTVHEGLRSETS